MTDLNLTIEHLRKMFQNTVDYVFYMKRTTDDYQYEYINTSALQNIPNISVSKTVTSVMEPKLAKTIFKYYNQAIDQYEQTQFQDYTMFSNEIKKHETTVYPIHQSDGQYILAITRQIVFDRNVEDKYLFMRSIFFKTFLSTVLISKDFELLEANPSFLNDFGISIEEVRGKQFDEIGLIDKKQLGKYLRYLQQSINGTVMTSKPIQFKDKNGQQRHFIASFSPLTDEDNEVIAAFIILQETTEFLRQEQQLKNVSHAMDIMKRALSTAADISFTDLNGRIIDVNERFIERTGYCREELLGETHNILNSGFHPKEFFNDLWETISTGNIWRGEVCNKTKQGVTYWNEATVIPLRDLEGNIFQYLGVYFNVSDKKEMMTELRNIERTFRLITDNTSDLIVIFDEQGIVSYASPSYERVFGMEEHHLIGQPYRKIIANSSEPQWQTVLSGSEVEHGKAELELLLPNGDTIWTECHYKVSAEGRYKGKRETTMVSRVITERKNYEKQLKFMAYHDGLTHLPNRSFLVKEFPHLLELANAKFQSIAVVYVDGDNFKRINDTYGHDVGDDFIRNFGRILAETVNSDGFVVRMGGDEFVIILNGLSRDREQYEIQVVDFFKQVQQRLQEGWETDGIVFNPTATMGVAMYPQHSNELDTLIELADQMLYEAKNIRKNSIKIYAI